jgi:predicted nucleotidyltransferase
MDWRFLQPFIEEQPHPLLFATVSGAHLYGFPSEDSDVDLRGVHVLPPELLLGLKEPKGTIDTTTQYEGREIDLVTHDVKKFFTLLLKRNGYVLEQILSPIVVHTTREHAELRSIATRCITRHHAHHYLGFSETQWALFKKESPPRLKPLLYNYRVLLTGIHLMNTGEIEANLVRLNEAFRLPWIPDLIARKTSGDEKGRIVTDLDFHENEILKLRTVLEKAHNRTSLPERETAREDLNDLLVRIRLKGVSS